MDIKEKWSKNKGKTKWSKHPIKRFRYCIHEFRWMVINGYPKWYAFKNWTLCYFGLQK